MKVNVQGVGLVEFPDDAKPDEITSALNQRFPAVNSEEKTPISTVDFSTLKPRPSPAMLTTVGGNPSPADTYDKSQPERLEDIKTGFTTPAVSYQLKVNPDDSKTVAVGKEVANLAMGIPEFLTSPAGIVTLPVGGIAPKLTMGAFSADALHNVGKEALETHKNWDNYTPAQKAAAVTDIAGGTAFAALLGKGALSKTKPITEAQNADTIKSSIPPNGDQASGTAKEVAGGKPGYVQQTPAAQAIQTPKAGVPETAKPVTEENIDSLPVGELSKVNHVDGMKYGIGLTDADVPRLEAKYKEASDQMAEAAKSQDDEKIGGAFGKYNFYGGSLQGATRGKHPAAAGNYDVFAKLNPDLVKNTETTPENPPVISESGEKVKQGDENPKIVGMGGATPSEFNPNASRDVTGLADRVRKQREDAGKTEPTTPGEGASPEEMVERGRHLLSSGVDPEAAMANFESTRRFSDDDMALTRARLEQLARAANLSEETFGTDSDEFRAASKTESDWAARSKKMQTAWSRGGSSQQGSVDIDTGTFSGLKRAYRDSHNGEDMPKEQEGQAKAMAEKNKKLAKENADLLKRISDEIEKEKVEPHVRIIADKLKGFFDTRASRALERIQARRAEGRLFAGIDPVELADYADYGASKILSKGIEGAEMTAEWAKEMADDLGDYIKPHLKQIWDASKATFEKEFTKIAGVGERAAKARKTAVKTDSEILEQKKSRLEKVIAQKREQIKSGDIAKKVKTPTVTSPEIEKLESEREQLDAQIRLMRDPDKFDSQTRAAEKAKAAADKVVREAAARAAEAETRARVEAQKLKTAAEKEQQIAAEKTANAAAKVARRNAAKLAKDEAKKASDKAVRDRDLKQVQLDAAKKASDQASKTVRNAAIARAKLEEANRIKAASKKLEPGTIEHARVEFSKYKGGKMNADQVASLWAYVKKNYIDKGYQGFTEIVTKTATDLGLSFKDVANGLGQPKNLRKLTNELWRKQTESRRFSDSAKRWVQQANTPLLGKLVPRFARFMFGAKTFGHGTVAFGTHAPMVAFIPKYSKAFFRDFGKMYKMVFSPAQYEVEVQALRSDPNFNTASRAGLVNDPYKVEDFNNPEMAQYFGRLSGAGNRGYFALKVLRQDMFNQGWDKLPESMKSDEMAQAMATDINHITGVVKSSSSGNFSSLALFAPRLLMSRVKFLAGDPWEALKIASTITSPAKWKALPEHEKFIVKNQVKQKATILAVAYGLLQANQYMLQAVGSNQKINLTDPTRSDFWKFKVAGMNFSFGNAMLNMARLPVRLWAIGAGDGGKLKNVVYPDESMSKVVEEFARSQASPISSLGLDFVFKGDYQERPLPQIPGYGKPIPIPKRLMAQGLKPYTWPEYFSEQISPIWAQEAEREVWRHGFGASDEQIKSYLKAAGTTIISAGTGGRVSEDLEPKQPKPTTPNQALNKISSQMRIKPNK